MSKDTPDNVDADLVLKIYDLRREPVMRESRDAINKDFWPKDEKSALAILQPDHPLNRAWRQTSSYWEMVYSFARHGVVSGDFLLESNGEGLYLFARIEPYLAAFRAATSPRTMRNAEWVSKETETGKALMATFRARITKALAPK